MLVSVCADKQSESFLAYTLRIPVKTGEEDEETIFSSRAKLYTTSDAGWKERGTGTLRCNVPKKNPTKGARLGELSHRSVGLGAADTRAILSDAHRRSPAGHPQCQALRRNELRIGAREVYQVGSSGRRKAGALCYKVRQCQLSKRLEGSCDQPYAAVKGVELHQRLKHKAEFQHGI